MHIVTFQENYGLFWGHFGHLQSESLQAPASTLLKSPWATCWITGSLQSHRFWPLWMRAKWKDKSHTCINPLAQGSAFVWTVPLSLKAATCLDEPAARCFCPVCVLVVGVKQNKSGTCLLRQHHHLSSHTIRTEGSPLAPRSECVKSVVQSRVSRRAHTCRFNFGLNCVLRNKLPKLIRYHFGD